MFCKEIEENTSEGECTRADARTVRLACARLEKLWKGDPGGLEQVLELPKVNFCFQQICSIVDYTSRVYTFKNQHSQVENMEQYTVTIIK